MKMSIRHLRRLAIRSWRHVRFGGSSGHSSGIEERFDLKFADGFADIHASVLLKTQMPRFPFQRG
jgi:hypothetical protein